MIRTFFRSASRLALGLALLCAIAACNSAASGSAGNGTGTTTPPAIDTATVTWIAPSRNADGSALTNLAGFHVYYGPDANVLSTLQDVPQPGASSTVIANLKAGTYYFAVSAYTSDGTESELSVVVSKQVG